jgi:anaerobic selenocysteine-containing dehydrogenase
MAAWSEETGTYTNYDGRLQIAHRAVAAPGQARPLAGLMSLMLAERDDPVPDDPAAVFALEGLGLPAFQGLDYEAIGPLGQPVSEVAR